MATGKILTAEVDGVYVFKFVGDVRVTLCGTLDKLVGNMLQASSLRAVVADLTKAQGIDSTSLGLLAKLAIHTQKCNDRKAIIICTNPNIKRTLESIGFDKIFKILEDWPSAPTEFTEAEEVTIPQDSLQQKVIEAHRILMSMNEANKEHFQDLVTMLEAPS